MTFSSKDFEATRGKIPKVWIQSQSSYRSDLNKQQIIDTLLQLAGMGLCENLAANLAASDSQ